MPIDENELAQRLRRSLALIGPDDCSTERGQHLKELIVGALASGIRFLEKETQAPPADNP